MIFIKYFKFAKLLKKYISKIKKKEEVFFAHQTSKWKIRIEEVNP